MNEDGAEVFKNNVLIEARALIRITSSDYTDLEKFALIQEVFSRIFDDLDGSSYKIILASENRSDETGLVRFIDQLEQIYDAVFESADRSILERAMRAAIMVTKDAS